MQETVYTTDNTELLKKEEAMLVPLWVNYVLPDGRGKGQVRPALVVRDWKQANGSVNLQVFVDGSNDYLAAGKDGIWGFTLWKTSVHYSADKGYGTWHKIDE